MYPNRQSRRWLLIPILVVASIVAIIIGTGVYFGAAGLIHPEGFYWFPFPFFPLVFIPLIFLFFFGFRWFFWGSCYGRGYDPAMLALRERYAKGEITREQLEQMSKTLEQN